MRRQILTGVMGVLLAVEGRSVAALRAEAVKLEGAGKVNGAGKVEAGAALGGAGKVEGAGGVEGAGKVGEARPIGVIEPPKGKVDEEVVSQSSQFRVSGGGAGDRGMLALIAEEAKVELLKLTEEKDEWKVPIRIRLHGKEGDRLPAKTVRLKLLDVEGMSELQVDVHLSRGVEVDLVKRVVTQALVYERVLKKKELLAADQKLEVPLWVVEGLREATAWRLNLSDRRLYEAVFKRGLYKMEDLLAVDEREMDEMDGASKAAFRVSAGALVMSLLEQPQGRDGFRAFLTEIGGYQGEVPMLLRKHFPEMNVSETSMAKWWTLQLANKGGLNLLTDSMSVEATERQLKEVLVFQYRNGEGLMKRHPLEQWAEVVKLSPEERLAAVKYLENGLVQLSYRCFPSYRPLIVDYQQIALMIAKGKPKDVDAKLVELGESRLVMQEKAKRARDYLDWYEITRARQISGEFEDYLKLKERLKTNPVRRSDSISKYLDRMDQIFYREDLNVRGGGGRGVGRVGDSMVPLELPQGPPTGIPPELPQGPPVGIPLELPEGLPK